MNRQHRLLMITRNFPPVTGGMERLTYHAYLELQRDFEVALLAPMGSEPYAPEGGRVDVCPKRPLAAFLACLQWKAYRVARQFAPHLIVASSGVSAPAAYWAGRVANAPVLCCLHGLDIVVPSRIYRSIFISAIRQCDAVIANSRNTADLARRAGVADHRVSILHPGVTIPADARPCERAAFRDRYGLGGCKVLLSVGRLLPRKGLPDFIRYVMPRLVARRDDVALVIIGEEPRNALAAAFGEARRIKDAASSAGVSKQIVMLGAVDDLVLRQAYAESDLMVFPVRHIPGDVEGFGMVALEAAAHGLPTAAFSSGGVGDAVSDGVSGYLIPAGSFDELARVILRHLEKSDREGWRARCMEYAKKFSWGRYGVQLRRICHELVRKHGGASAR